jgi:hypothetical protein
MRAMHLHAEIGGRRRRDVDKERACSQHRDEQGAHRSYSMSSNRSMPDSEVLLQRSSLNGSIVTTTQVQI